LSAAVDAAHIVKLECPEHRASKVAIHEKVGLQGERLGVVVANPMRTVRGDDVGHLALAVPILNRALILNHILNF
jgi:hypothetical protein